MSFNSALPTKYYIYYSSMSLWKWQWNCKHIRKRNTKWKFFQMQQFSLKKTWSLLLSDSFPPRHIWGFTHLSYEGPIWSIFSRSGQSLANHHRFRCDQSRWQLGSGCKLYVIMAVEEINMDGAAAAFLWDMDVCFALDGNIQSVLTVF